MIVTSNGHSEFYRDRVAVVRSLAQRTGSLAGLLVDGRPVEEALPGLFEDGEVLCLSCARFYHAQECPETVIEQRWGSVTARTCPVGHVHTEAHVAPDIARQWRTRRTLGQQADDLDAEREA